MLKFEEINYDYFGKCLKITNEAMEMLVTVDLGPRIISYHLLGKENIMCEDRNENSTMAGGLFSEVFGDKKWYIYGGHRLWFSPEHNPRSYYPDNDRVDYKIEGNKVTFTPPPQYENGLRFEMTCEFSDLTAEVRVGHKITNLSDSEVKLSAWAMTVVDENSTAILPQCQKDTGLLSNRNLSLWAYTDIYDDRLFIGNKFITVKQSTCAKRNLKVGLNNEDGWLGMLNKGQFFVKKFDYDQAAEYPDNHCNCECFTNFFMMEIESLGPLTVLGKGDSACHTENWNIFACDLSFDRKNEDSIDEFLTHQVMPI